MTSPSDTLGRLLSERRALIGIVGLGYVGLPLALAALRAGFPVLGFDVDPGRVAALNRGEGAFHHIPGEALGPALAAGTFEATSDMARLPEPDAVLICVPTPLTRHREPDLSYVEATARAIAATLRPGQLVVLESTTYPGTTAEVMRPILEAGGLRSGRDFFLAYSPEREDPGNGEFDTARIPKVVGADDAAARSLAEALYGALVVRTVPVSSAAAAEAVKLTENIFRSVNIALVNELKLVYDAMGIDVWEVIQAAATKPFGFMPFQPGPGLGGHCIPIDPFYLAWKAREFDVPARFVELAGEVNTRMPYHVVERLAAAVDRTGRAFSSARVLVLGLAYKRNVEDTRESPALKLIRLIEARGAIAQYHDPLVPVLPATREHPDLAGRRSESLTPETLRAVDAVLIATDHDGVDYGLVAAEARLIVDTRNVMARHGLTGATIVKA
ncbi:nucleotide sugar dehydrogenase [Methylobacterium frigidaeris]|uniref:UDP-N-acetyl-D-glucosamine 6-dehydrogenase n=1 Tax=Methylobacterium frigidaeris TaxID=2038277 RepID=A0AA37M3N9_9HYPH|nr:nucleotide sugar dehydrogenase [Methylobacterium frigidaeris]PIK71338.1 UDP-N-acetyl-D-glucosamine dehydrogenase [Methylobacterium frigidaeris]GJD61582.1 UDP-N-acetyl-D-glucosamine 6-dehydrogenase [Methylobacterium frigidaeris]